jgi:hypothetical protein
MQQWLGCLKTKTYKNGMILAAWSTPQLFKVNQANENLA